MGDYGRERRKSEGRSQLGEGKKKWRNGGQEEEVSRGQEEVVEE